jgi:hypothetical protein
LQQAGRLHALSECIYALLLAKILRLGEEVSLLGTGTEGRLAAAGLEAVRLEDALEGLGGRTLAGAAATTGHASTNGGRREGGGHFVLRVRQTFRMNARSKKMEPVSIGLLVGFFLVGVFGVYGCLVRKRVGMAKSPSSENLADMVPQEDPTHQES